MKYLGLILVVLFLYGCNSDKCGSKDGAYTDIAMYGDSLCRACGSSPDIAKISKRCNSGSALVNLDVFEDQHKLIFLAKGTNDIIYNVSPDDYESHLLELIGSTDSEIVCILPNPNPTLPSEGIRDAMINNCSSYIDPIEDCGVSVGDPDGIHYTKADHIALSACLIPIVDEFNISKG